MARMIPSPMRVDTESEAEQLLYRKFAEELPAEYTVIHQARWVARRWGRRGMDGEADFVVLHPTRGVLVLEAKGGGIERTADGGWVSRRGRETRALKQSPMEQAADSRRAFETLFREIPVVRDRLLHLVHAIALPHHDVRAFDLGLDAPEERVLDGPGLQDVAGWVRRALASVDPPRRTRTPLGEDGIERIVEAAAVDGDLRVFTPTVAEGIHRKLASLTKEQYRVLSLLSATPRARVTGGPGTGKTLLAIEAARRFAAQGLRTLLVCFNAPLGGHLRSVTADIEGLTATYFHDLCRSRARAAGFEAKIAAAENAAGYEHVFPEVLLDVADAEGALFDAIVVDEAQDFRETWWAALEGCLRGGGEGCLYLFDDEEQLLDERRVGARPGDLGGPYPLTRDCRNPDEIHAFLAACPGGPRNQEPAGACTGIRPRVRWVVRPEDTPREVSRAVARLITECSVPPAEIAVLTPRAAPRSTLGEVTQLGPAPAVWRERERKDQVLIDTVHRFKGLEATAVVLAEVSPDVRPDLATHLRVGCSRPTVHLELLASPDTEPHLRDALAFADVVGAAARGEPAS